MSGHKSASSKAEKVKQCTYYIDGMHCPSCEILIEKQILKQEGIEAVDANLGDEKITVSYVGTEQPSLGKLNAAINKHGYKVQKNKVRKKDSPLLRLGANGSVQINKQKLGRLVSVIMVLVVAFIGYILYSGSALEEWVNSNAQATSTPAFFVSGIVAGFSSCAALLGGMILSMSKQWNETYLHGHDPIKKAQPHLFFHIGRVVSFTFFGGVLGLLGSFLFSGNPGEAVLSPQISAMISLMVSTLLLLLALQMLGVGWAQRFKITAPKFITRYAADEGKFANFVGPFGLGVFTFIIPCSVTIAAQLAAFTSGSLVTGAVILFLFSMGTLIPLGLISFTGLGATFNRGFANAFNSAIALIILFAVFYSYNAALVTFGLPNTNTIAEIFNPQPETVTAVVNEAGIQTLNLTAKGFNYIPTTGTVLKAGVPTELVVDNQGIKGCGAFIASSGLIDNFIALKPGENKISLDTPSLGTYYISCSMGMVPPVTVKFV